MEKQVSDIKEKIKEDGKVTMAKIESGEMPLAKKAPPAPPAAPAADGKKDDKKDGGDDKKKDDKKKWSFQISATFESKTCISDVNI